MRFASKLLRSSATLLIMQVLQRSLGILSTLVLARILLPEDFGITAIAILVIYLGGTLSDSGIAQYITQVTDIDDDVVNTAWSLDVFLKGLASLLIVLFIPLFDVIWGSSEVNLAIGVLAPAIFIRAFANPQLHIDARNLDYRNILTVNVLVKLISFFVVIISAMILRSFWALIIGFYAGSIALVVVSWYTYDRKVRFGKKNIREQWNFSKWILSRGFLGFFRAHTDAFIISRYFSLSLFGNFTVAKEITVMPATDILSPLTAPLLSSLSRVKNDAAAWASQVRIAFLLICIISLPICAYVFVYSDLIVALFLGDKWASSAAIMSALAPLVFSYSLGGLVNNMMISLGHLRSLFFYDMLSLIVLVVLLLYLRNTDIITVVVARSSAGFVVTMLATMWISRLVGIRAYEFLLLLLGPVLLAFLAAGITSVIHASSTFLMFISTGILHVIVYSITTLLFAICFKKHSSSWNYLYELCLKYFEQIRMRLKQL